MTCRPLSSSAIALAAILAADSPAGGTVEPQPVVVLVSNQIWPATGDMAQVDGHDGNGVIAIRGAVDHARIGPSFIGNAYRAVETSSTATVSNLVIDGLRADVTRACIHVDGERLAIRNVRCRMIGGPQHERANMPAGLHVTSGGNVSVENSRFEDFQWTGPSDRYWNGDGVLIEDQVAEVFLHNVVANGNSDAGFDLKPFVRMSNVSASDNCRNFRLWSGAEIGTLTTGDAVYRGGISSCQGIWIEGAKSAIRPRVHIQRLVVRMTRPGTIIQVDDGPADIAIDRCEIAAPPGTIFVLFNHTIGRLSLGAGCKRFPVRKI